MGLRAVLTACVAEMTAFEALCQVMHSCLELPEESCHTAAPLASETWSLLASPVCCSQAEFTTATTLQLTGVTTTVQFHDANEQGAPAPTDCPQHLLA